MCVPSSLSTSSRWFAYCRIVLIHRCSLSNVCFIGYYVIGTILVVLSALITIYHDQIVDWLKPAANWMKEYVDIHSCASIVCKLMAAHSLPAGWLIPIAILFVISFPPVSLSFCFVRQTCDIRAGSDWYTPGLLGPSVLYRLGLCQLSDAIGFAHCSLRECKDRMHCSGTAIVATTACYHVQTS